MKVKMCFLWLIALALILGSCGGESDPDQFPVLTVTPNVLTLSSEQKTATFAISSGGNWSISMKAEGEWCKLSATSGSGNADITVTGDENTLGKDRQATLSISGDGGSATVIVKQLVANLPPSAPQLQEPADKLTDVSVAPLFTWVISVDPENDEITYVVSYSKDQKTWVDSEAIKENKYSLSKGLETQTTYYWKVTATDNRGGAKESEIRRFTTSGTGIYKDGELLQRVAHTKGKRGVRLVITGDGFIPSDYEKGGFFDKVVEEAYTGLFSFEPFKTYQAYFDVFQVAAYSKERGITDERTGKAKVRKTCFDTRFGDYPTMTIGSNGDGSNIFNWIKTVMKIDESDLPQTIIIVVANEDSYGGCCYMSSDQKTIAVCAYSKQMLDPSGTLHGRFINLIAHEAGGHAIGMLAEEYVNVDEEISTSETQSVKVYQKEGGFLNISLTNLANEAPWKEFIGKEGYEEVGFYEGGNTYGKGVWRAERLTCMDNNSLYYSAAARRAIVNRIMRMSGELPLTLEQFVANDSKEVGVLPDAGL